ncbi:MAG: hypothetical protein CMA63_04610 [Euryarchaeota archaeon]|nr:hypothetical protein [Euryarchaeota archaeon]
MDADSLEERMALWSGTFKKLSPVILVVAFLFTATLGFQLASSPPTFNTDLSDFAPDSESSDAHERIHDYFPNESRPMFVHVEADDGSNILSIENIHAMNEHLLVMKNESSKRQDAVKVWTTAPGIVQLGLDEEGDGASLQSMESWGQIIDLIFKDEEKCSLTSDDQLLSAARYASSALLHTDLNIDASCTYLSDGTGDGAPRASSTLWVLEIDPNMDAGERKIIQDQLRDQFAVLSSSSNLSYGVASLDLMSFDIDEGTFDNLALLIVLALAVVVLLLAIAFRSIHGVLFPLIGLSSALIWTYGSLSVLGIQFTALEVAVAPLVLGLGIDYAIHLQRAFAAIRKQHPDPSEAWIRSCSRLSVPLSLAVITTVSAFLANLISPLPPIATFGSALAFGVVCAFICSTVIVGALHVVGNRSTAVQTSNPIRMPAFVNSIVAVQQKQQVGVILMAILISGVSIFGALSLETDFDLADFVDPDMEIMEVRDDIATSYDSAGWKLVYILFEPLDGQSTVPGDSTLLDELRGLHVDLETNHGVVGTDVNPPSPSYEGPYVVLRDAILRDNSFGVTHNLEVYAGGVYVENDSLECDLGSAFSALSSNETVADALTGETWAERIEQTVSLTGGEIQYLRNEIRVEASTSSEAEKVISNIEEQLGSESSSGTLRSSLAGHAQLYVTGDLVILQTVLDGLNASQVKSTAISLAVSCLVLLILTRRFIPAVVVLLPVALASLWVAGSMAALGLKWNVLTVMVTALTLGIGIDYSIHMWRRIEVELKRQDSHWDALRAALSTTGVALVISALTTAFGFMVLLFSPMPVIQDFGLITAVTVFFSLLLALLLLPVLVELTARNQEAVVRPSAVRITDED